MFKSKMFRRSLILCQLIMILKDSSFSSNCEILKTKSGRRCSNWWTLTLNMRSVISLHRIILAPFQDYHRPNKLRRLRTSNCEKKVSDALNNRTPSWRQVYNNLILKIPIITRIEVSSHFRNTKKIIMWIMNMSFIILVKTWFRFRMTWIVSKFPHMVSQFYIIPNQLLKT